MAMVKLPYGKGTVEVSIPEGMLRGVLTTKLNSYQPEFGQTELVRRAMEQPIGSPRLGDLVKNKKKIVIIASDHTRPVPSKVIMPLMLAEIRGGNPQAEITILISTGCHRGTTVEELIGKFGEEIVKNERIVIHDCDDEKQLVNIGILPSGGELVINKLAVEADLLLAEGFIEPHFFAGFSGGRKSVLPGIAGRGSVLANHCSEFIAHPCARTGVLEGNPIHADMVYAAKKAGLAFIVNVVLNPEKEIIYAVAGDVVEVHEKGCEFLGGLCGATCAPADIVITTNGGYPLDQNIYQAVKGMTAAESAVKAGGVIIMLAKSDDGHGGEEFYRTFKEQKDLAVLTETFLARGRGETIADQWQSLIFARILRRARVIYVSAAPDTMVADLHMTPAKSVEEALKLAVSMLKKDNPELVVIPDGVSVIIS